MKGQEINEEEAIIARSLFYLAMRSLPYEQRTAMFQVYAFCRAVDDISDSDLPRIERKAALDFWREKSNYVFLDNRLHI